MLLVRILWGQNDNGKLGKWMAFAICGEVGLMLLMHGTQSRATTFIGRYLGMNHGYLFRLPV
jgi:hypothetical protein